MVFLAKQLQIHPVVNKHEQSKQEVMKKMVKHTQSYCSHAKSGKVREKIVVMESHGKVVENQKNIKSHGKVKILP